jgi:hypothetical protein
VQRRLVTAELLALALFCWTATSARAQPFSTWVNFTGPTDGWVSTPHSADLNPAGALTVEAWVRVTDADGCSSIVGKDWMHAWWVGICGTTLRSYTKGGLPSQVNGGTLPAGVWTHVAVVSDGSTRKHYVNGELAVSVAEPTAGPLGSSTGELRIGSDVAWQHTPAGDIDEVHVWNTARTLAQIRTDLAAEVNGPIPGLVASWHINCCGSPTFADASGNGHILTASGAAFTGETHPLANCSGLVDANTSCLNNRFAVKVRFRTSPPGSAPDGLGTRATGIADSAVYWFFSSTNWELLLKVLNGCGLNSRYWMFSAATTNVFYRLEIADVTANPLNPGGQKIYFNYPGPPAPAVTDVNAFATCP